MTSLFFCVTISVMEKIVNGYSIRYKETGQGPKIAVVLQGWGTDMKLYDSVAADLADSYKVIQLNLPGFSDSDEPKEPWSVEDYCNWFIAFMQEMKIEKATLIGHSYGCRMMIRMAARDPKDLPFTIEEMVMVDGAGIQREKTPAQKRRVKRYKRMKAIAHFAPIYWLFGDAVDIWQSQQGSADYRASSPMMKQCMSKAVNEDQSPLLPKIAVKTYLIWGENDTATPLRDGEDMERMIQDAQLYVIKGAGHFSFVEKQQEFKIILRSFLLGEGGQA